MKIQSLGIRGQLVPFAFIILLVAGGLIGYILYNIYYGTKYQILVSQTYRIDVIRNLIEAFKNYLKLSLTYSSGQALREHACLSGLVRARPWICNGPNPPTVEQSKECLGEYTKYYLNVYSSLFDTHLPLTLLKLNFTDCFYDVNRGDVFSGEHDEGDFWVNCSSGKISVSSEDIHESEKINTNEFVTKNRYWYMFRIFYEWAMADVYSPCICEKIGCACGSASSEEECSRTCLTEVEECAQRALEDLQRRFDEDVICNKKFLCCAQGRGPSCLPPSDCISWINSICISDCMHRCPRPPMGELCPLGQSHSFSQDSNFTSEPYIKFSSSPSLSCYCEYWHEARLAAGYEFRCVDYKYYVPSDRGPVPLTFIAHAYAFWRDQDACRSTNLCHCPEDATSCSQCSGACCTPCH